MKFSQKLSLLFPLTLVVVLVALAYGNVTFLRRSLNPVLLIPQREIQSTTGYSDIAGNADGRHGWHVDLANPAYLEWPVNLAIGRALKAGHIPLVMPDQNLGIPLAGQYCHRIFSPYQIIENLFLPAGYDFFILLRLVLAGAFTYLFLRPLCQTRVAALLGAVGFGLGSIMVIYSNHEEVSNVAMTVPILLWAVRAFFDRPNLGRTCWLALALALVHTASQPEIQLYVLLLALVYGLTRLFSLPPGRKNPAFFSSLGAIVLSALIAAPQFVLFLLFHEEAWTYHPPGGELGLQSPMTVANFLFTFFPRLRQTPWPWSYRTINLLWDWVGGYFGLGLLILAGAAGRRTRRNRREVMVFGSYFLFVLAKNLGWSPAQLLGLLPFFDQTWSPRWAAASWSFALAVLAALGLDNLLDKAEPFRPAAGTTPHRRASAFLTNPLVISGLLLLGLILSAVFWWQAGELWKKAQLRGYVFSNGLLCFSLAGVLYLIYRLISAPLRRYLSSTFQKCRKAFRHRQFEVIGLLSAAGAVALRWFPERHYHFPLPEPIGAYLLAAPILLAALAGLFIIAASPANFGTVAAVAVAIPLALAGGWAILPPGPLPNIWWAIFVLDLAGFLLLPPNTRTRRVILPVLSAILLAGLAALFFTSGFFSPQADEMLRLHFYFAVLIVAFFSWLCLRARGEGAGTGMGWLFLFPVWAELAIYIPRNHFDKLLLIDKIPFAIAAAVVIFAVFWRRKRPFLMGAGLVLSGAAFLIIDSVSSPRLSRQSSPREPLAFVRFLQERQPYALTGVGRVLAPNFASAHGLVDLRGCVSMNPAAYQFFLEQFLQVVPSNSSYSLWYTGDNPITHSQGTPYGSSQSAQVRAFERSFPFFRLAGTRYILSPPGALDRSSRSAARLMIKIYSGKVDIWEISALPPTFIAHRAEVISMLGDPRRWGTTIIERKEVLEGKLVLLEEESAALLPPGRPSPLDRAKLITGENPNRFQVRFYTESPGYLIVNRLHTNLLRASLEGKNLPILPANGPFFAVPVLGADRERMLEISYLSPPVRWSYRLALAGLLITAAGLAAGLIRSRRKEGNEVTAGK